MPGSGDAIVLDAEIGQLNGRSGRPGIPGRPILLMIGGLSGQGRQTDQDPAGHGHSFPRRPLCERSAAAPRTPVHFKHSSAMSQPHHNPRLNYSDRIKYGTDRHDEYFRQTPPNSRPPRRGSIRRRSARPAEAVAIGTCPTPRSTLLLGFSKAGRTAYAAVIVLEGKWAGHLRCAPVHHRRRPAPAPAPPDRARRCLPAARHLALFPTDFRLKQRLSNFLQLDFRGA